MNRIIRMGVFVLCPALLSSLCLPLYADSCDDAKDKGEKYLSTYEDVRHLLPEEQQEFVKVACEADDEELPKVLEEGGHRVESQVLSQIDELNSLRDDALSSLKTAIDADECKDKEDDLTKLQDRVVKISERIEKMSNGVRMGSNPVFNAMRDLGQKAHKEYQDRNSGFNNVREKYGNAEVSLPDISRRVDFMDPKDCQVVELKPESNSSAQSEGFDDAKKARDWLNDADNRKQFVEKYPAYAKCEKFVARVDCYRYCPEVQEDGELHLGDIEWKTGCKGPE
jgi:hypothetical protein